jgi:hypothetical protein
MDIPVTERESSYNYVSAKQVPENIPPPAERKRSRALWILLLVFLVFVATVFLTQHEETINWVEDYDTGIKLAKQKNKPILLAFYNKDIPFCWAMERHVYNNPNVIEYVETNFIPILIDVDIQPVIVKQYNISSYPTHYVEYPNSNELSEPLIGCYPQPTLFIERIDHLLNTIKQSNK